jgi:putative nucleotidyltransferase with HDIG domain
MQRRVVVYVGGVTLAAMLVSAILYYADPRGAWTHVYDAVGLAIFIIIAELLTYQLPGGGTGSIALIPFMAVALVAPEAGSMIAVGLAMTVVQAMHRRSLIKAAFNISQAILSLGLGVLAYRLLGGGPLGDTTVDGSLTPHLSVGPAIALVAVFVVVNTAAVSGVLALTEESSAMAVWRRNTLSTGAYYIFTVPFALGLAWVYVRFGPWVASAVALPLMGVRQLYKTTLQLQQNNRDLLELMIKAVEARDPYTSGHSRRVAQYSTVIAQALQLSARTVEHVRVAALLHDVGKIHEEFAPILSKEGRLTDAERAMIETHPIKSAMLVATVSQLRDVVKPVRHHHENWDGTGYPDRLAGEDIPLASRIIMFADTIDAMTSDRPYRRALGQDAVTAELVKMKGRQFDPVMCDALLASPLYATLFKPTLTHSTPRAGVTIITSPSLRAALSA